MVGLEIVVECYQVEAQIFGNDIYSGATRQCRIHIHHACIEAIAGVSRHVVLRPQAVETLIPMAEGHQITVCQLATLWHSSGTGSIEEDEKTLWRQLRSKRLDITLQALQVFCQQHLAFVFVYQVAQFPVGNEQSGIGIFHHEDESLFWIAGVERLICASGLQHTERGDGHPLAAGDEHRDDILQSEPFF